MSNTVKYYFIAPTWHNHPVSGAMQMGNILTDLRTPELPVYRGPPPPVPTTLDTPPELASGEQTTSWQTNYEFSTDDLKAGKLGLWTKFLSVLGVGVNLGYEWDKTAAQQYTFKRLETREFVPSDEYIQACLDAPPVARLLERKKRTFYIVTGIKAVTGAKASRSNGAGHKVSCGVEVDATLVGGVPVSVGPEAEVERKRSESIRWDGSSDFVFAYRVQKISISSSGELRHEDYKKGAAMEPQRRKGQLDREFLLSAPEASDITNAGFTLEDAGGGDVYALSPQADNVDV